MKGRNFSSNQIQKKVRILRRPLSEHQVRKSTKSNSSSKELAQSLFLKAISSLPSNASDLAKQKAYVGEVAKYALLKSIASGTAKKKTFKTLISAVKETVPSKGNCVDTASIAIGLLNLMGVKSWLVRQVKFDLFSKKYLLHDMVEFVHAGKVHTLFFGFVPESEYFDVRPGFADRLLHDQTAYYLRGIDSQHIGGVKNKKTFVRFARNTNYSQGINQQLKKNKTRINMLSLLEIMPREVADHLLKQ